MKRTAILHIGTEKTGTTSIQEALYLNRELLSGFGIHFLQCAGEKNNRHFPSSCMADEKYDDFFKDRQITSIELKERFRADFLDRFATEINSLGESIHTVLISSEHFHSRTNTLAEIIAVSEVLAPFFDQVRIICYLREQAQTCNSLYSTAIKAGLNPDPDIFFSRCSVDNNYYNYYEMLSNWASIFGSENLFVRKFDRKFFRNGDLLDDFFSLLNDELPQYVNRDFEIQNESLSMLGMFLGRAVNVVLPKYTDHGYVDLARVEAIDFIYENFKGKGLSIPEDVKVRIYETFYDSNVLVNEAFLGGSGALFEPASKAVDSTLSDKDFNIDSMVEIFSIVNRKVFPLSDEYADALRDGAVALENTDLKKALSLMLLAEKIRPDGPFIRKKISEYKRKIRSL
ncbi:hypothetical protein [Oceanobacter mangrovi]|uniref:hypothetical protein n=1 Tax=Oceanobacter mangrovi TaxID=2862510 RepID=UPI001C8D7024|nr:hypothetical protein [Oceanobacter mangrovi]